MEIIQQDESKIVCKLDNVSRIDDEFLKKLEWPAGRKIYVLVLGETLENEAGLAARVTDKAPVWLVYCAQKSELGVGAGGSAQIAGIRSSPLKNLEEVKRCFIETREGYYRANGYTFTPRQVEETKDFLANYLPKSRHVHVENDGRTAGLMLLNAHVYLGRPTDIIPWFWVDTALSGDKRAAIIALMRNWLAENISEQVYDFCNLDRPEMHGLDRALGLSAVAIHVLKVA